jgi:hypothetical protein
MNSKTVLILFGVVALLAAVAAILLRPAGEDASQKPLGQKLLSDLPFEKIEKIRIISTSKTVTVEKKPGGWGVVEKSGYPADFSKISELVEKLRNLKVGRRFAADAQITDRLTLHPPSEGGADPQKTATQLVLLDAENRPLADLLIGSARESERGFGGHYLMRTGQPTVLLVDKSFKYLSATPAEWLKREVVDLDAEEIESVTYRKGSDPGETVYRIRRPAKGAAWEFDGAGKDGAIDRGKADRLAEALSPLRAEDVVSVDEAGANISFSEADRFVYSTFAGRAYTIDLGTPFARDEESFTHARLSESPAPGTAEEPDEFSGWIYVLSEWKAKDFIRERAQLLTTDKQ